MIVLINSTEALQHSCVISGMKYLKKVANMSLSDKTVSSNSCRDHCSFFCRHLITWGSEERTM